MRKETAILFMMVWCLLGMFKLWFPAPSSTFVDTLVIMLLIWSVFKAHEGWRETLDAWERTIKRWEKSK